MTIAVIEGMTRMKLWSWRLLTKATAALCALFIAACGGSGAALPTGPAAPPVQPVQIEGGQLLTHGNAVAYLPAGVPEYRAAIVFLPGLRDPATGNPLDSRPIVTGATGGCF